MDERERGKQRRRDLNGRPLHCCCICGVVERWSASWSHYSSVREEDEEKPYPKFCSPACQEKGGPRAENVTKEMKRVAKDKEWRDPKPYYEPPTYMDAVDQQRRAKSRSDAGDPANG